MPAHRLTARELRRLANLSGSRVRTVRAEPLSQDLHLHHPAVHKQVLNHLFVLLLTSAADEDAVAREFYRVYRHLVEGRPLSELPLTLTSRDEFLSFFNAIRSAVSDDDPDAPANTNDRRRGRHGEHDRSDDGDDRGDGDGDGNFDDEE